MAIPIFQVIEFLKLINVPAIRRTAVMLAYVLLAVLIVLWVLTFGAVLAVIVIIGNLLLPPLDERLKREKDE